MELNFKYDVFISFAHGDTSKVRRIYEKLTKYKLRVFWANRKIKPGSAFPNQLEQGLRHSRHFALYCSLSSIRSSWVEKEWQLFLKSYHLKDKENRMMYILLDKKCPEHDVPELLSDIHRPGSLENLIVELIHSKIDELEDAKSVSTDFREGKVPKLNKEEKSSDQLKDGDRHNNSTDLDINPWRRFWYNFADFEIRPLVVLGTPPVWIKGSNDATRQEGLETLKVQSGELIVNLNLETSEYTGMGDVRAFASLVELAHQLSDRLKPFEFVTDDEYENLINTTRRGFQERPVVFLGGPTANKAALASFSVFCGVDSSTPYSDRLKEMFLFFITSSGKTDDKVCTFLLPLIRPRPYELTYGGIIQIKERKKGKIRVTLRYSDPKIDYGILFLAVSEGKVKMIWASGYRTGGTRASLISISTINNHDVPETIDKAMNIISEKSENSKSKFLIQLVFETSEYNKPDRSKTRLVDAHVISLNKNNIRFPLIESSNEEIELDVPKAENLGGAIA